MADPAVVVAVSTLSAVALTAGSTLVADGLRFRRERRLSEREDRRVAYVALWKAHQELFDAGRALSGGPEQRLRLDPEEVRRKISAYRDARLVLNLIAPLDVLAALGPLDRAADRFQSGVEGGSAHTERLLDLEIAMRADLRTETLGEALTQLWRARGRRRAGRETPED